MEYRFEVSPRAMAEANTAYEWIARNSPARAARWYRGLFARIETLTTEPTRFVRAPEAEALGQEIRQLLYGRRGGVYRVLFTVEGDVVRILSIRWHCKPCRNRVLAGSARRANTPSPSSNTKTPAPSPTASERLPLHALFPSARSASRNGESVVTMTAS